MSSIIIFLSLIITLQNISYSQVGPFYPYEAHSRGITEITLGYVIGSFSIMYIISAIVSGKMLHKMGHSAGLKIGMLFIVV